MTAVVNLVFTSLLVLLHLLSVCLFVWLGLVYISWLFILASLLVFLYMLVVVYPLSVCFCPRLLYLLIIYIFIYIYIYIYIWIKFKIVGGVLLYIYIYLLGYISWLFFNKLNLVNSVCTRPLHQWLLFIFCAPSIEIQNEIQIQIQKEIQIQILKEIPMQIQIQILK